VSRRALAAALAAVSRRALAAALAAALGGCTLAPRHERPAAPVAGQFPGAGGGGAVAAELGWRDVFGDPRLQRLIELALAQNRDLRVAALNVELVRAQYRIQRAEMFPALDAIGRADVSGGSGEDVTTLYQVGASASYELDLFGRVRSLKQQALEQYLATEQARRAAHLALIGEVVSQYLRERALDEQRVLAERTLETVTESLEMTSRLLEAGQRSELDMKTAEAQVHAARAEVARLRRLHAQAENALVLVVGAPLPRDLPPAPLLETQRFMADISAGLPSELLQRRPDILAAEHELKAANASIGAARAAFFPRISLTGFAGFASAALSSLLGGGLAWSFVPQITVPLFQGGANAASLDVAEVRTRIEVARYERAIQVAFREVADALVARAHLDAQLEAQVERAAAEQRRFEISETRYRNGVESYLTVLAAQQDLYQAQQQLIEVRLARLSNLADLYRALGGGWLERSQPGAPAAASASLGARDRRGR